MDPLLHTHTLVLYRAHCFYHELPLSTMREYENNCRTRHPRALDSRQCATNSEESDIFRSLETPELLRHSDQLPRQGEGDEDNRRWSTDRSQGYLFMAHNCEHHVVYQLGTEQTVTTTTTKVGKLMSSCSESAPRRHAPTVSQCFSSGIPNLCTRSEPSSRLVSHTYVHQHIPRKKKAKKPSLSVQSEISNDNGFANKRLKRERFILQNIKRAISPVIETSSSPGNQNPSRDWLTVTASMIRSATAVNIPQQTSSKLKLNCCSKLLQWNTRNTILHISK
ncbi:hypothetical protein J6590_022294 [Homalodisca vitripennis]|nr:hypothetical protein J6590_022294 [Homalodisca vitripennis]